MVSRGLKPTDRGEHTIRRRGATAERSNRTVAFNRRSATRDQNILLRGLKSTATIVTSLREANPRKFATGSTAPTYPFG